MMSRDQLIELLIPATQVGVDAPRTFNAYAYLTNVQIDSLNRLRAALEPLASIGRRCASRTSSASGSTARPG